MVAGWTEPRNTRSRFGALLLGAYALPYGAVVEMPPGSGAKVYHLPEGDVECVYTIHSEPATLPLAFRRRAPFVVLLVGLLLGQSMDAYSEATRRREPLDFAVSDRGRCQAFLDAFGQRTSEREQRFRRQLFGAELEQEVALGHALRLRPRLA